MKKKFILFSVAICIVFLSACGSSNKSTSKTTNSDVSSNIEESQSNSQDSDNKKSEDTSDIEENVHSYNDGKEENSKESIIEEEKEKTTSENNTVSESNNNNSNNEKEKETPDNDEIIPEPKTTDKPINNTQNSNDNSTSSNSSLDNTVKGWYYMPRTDGVPPTANAEGLKAMQQYNGYYLGDTSSKVIYLTFDEGYENGYTTQILDILKANGVRAAFFATSTYLNNNKDLVRRMVSEGHIVGNHSTTHPSMPELSSVEKFNNEILNCASTFKNITGQEMPQFFRPPMGKYSTLSLKRTNDLGYKTIFWSFAYHDWDPKNQPSLDEARKTILERSHPGGIYLLHAVSKTNTELLDELIKTWKSKGYVFKTLYDL